MLNKVVSVVCVVLLVFTVLGVALAPSAAAAMGPACDAFYNSNYVTGGGALLIQAIACFYEDQTFFW